MNKTSENLSLICPNKDCGRVVTKSLSTLNIDKDSRKTYNSCPFCLTELFLNETKNEGQIEKEVSEIEFEEKHDIEKKEDEDKGSNHEVDVKSVVQNEANKLDCKYHLGYLGEEKHEQIPDECLVCLQIIECMHQKSKNN